MKLSVDFQRDAKEKCVFCDPSPELVLRTTEHFILMLDPFPLIPGHLLMTSRFHYGCLGEVPMELQSEAIMLRNFAYTCLHDTFQASVTRYEHGRAGHCVMRERSSRFCHHYHEHLIPQYVSVHSSLLPHFQCISYQSEHELCALYERYNEYLLVVEPSMERQFYVAKNKVVAPHLLRTLFARALGCPERDNWETIDSCEWMLQGKRLLAASILSTKEYTSCDLRIGMWDSVKVAQNRSEKRGHKVYANDLF